MLALQGHDGALGHDVAQLGEAIAAIEASTVWFVCR